MNSYGIHVRAKVHDSISSIVSLKQFFFFNGQETVLFLILRTKNVWQFLKKLAEKHFLNILDEIEEVFLIKNYEML